MPLPLSTVVTEHAVIARYRLTGDGYGDPSERAAVLKAQAILAEAVERAGVGEFDGNEFGAGEAVALRLRSRCRRALRCHGAHVA